MRVGTFTMYYNFNKNQETSMRQLNNVNNQMASNTKIEYGYQDTNIFIDTLRLDKEAYTLAQNTKGAETARQFAATTDTTMNDMVTALTDFKTKLVGAANESNSVTSRRAIAQELTAIRQNFMNLANTSIDGQHLFSGSAFTQKPIDSNGDYHGNGEDVKALVSAGVQLPFNVDGKGLFLGSDSDYNRVVSTNVAKKNMTLLHETPSTDRYITTEDTIQDMTGNNGDGKKSYFYVSGALSDGTSFKQRLDIDIGSTIGDLMDKIKNIYKDNVDVSLNKYGQIEVKDLRSGSSKLQFHMVATDNSTALTKATAGFTAGSTSLTVKDATAPGIEVGDLLNIEGLGQVLVSARSNSAPGTITFATTPLPAGAEFGVTEVNVKKVLSTNVTANSAIAVGANTINVNSTNGLVVGQSIAIGNAGAFTVTGLTATSITFNATSASSVSIGDNVNFVADISDLSSSGTAITEFVKSGMGPLNTPPVAGAVSAWNDRMDHAQFNFNIELKNRSTGAASQSQELLSTATGGLLAPASINLNGTNYAFALGATSTVGDFVNSVQTALNTKFGSDKFAASLIDGKVVVKDLTINPTYSSTQSSALTKMTLDFPANTFASVNGIESDKAYFEKSGSRLTSNVSQIVKTTNAYVAPVDTVLSASGLTTMVGEQLTMQVQTLTGASQTVTVDFAATGSTFKVGANTYTIFNAASPQAITPPDQVTYRQLMDVMSMVVSNVLPATVATATDYNSAVKAAKTQAAVTLDNNGKIVIEDKTSTATKASLSMYDTSTNTAFTNTLTYNTSSVTLNSNNAITIDDPYVSIFDQMQMAIDAVSANKTRATSDGTDPRNVGIQNALFAIDHLLDHTIRKHTEIGAVSNAFQTSADRTTTLGLNIKTVRSEVLDTDIASAYLELTQRTQNYQALLSTVSKINGLSILNYL